MEKPILNNTSQTDSIPQPSLVDKMRNYNRSTSPMVDLTQRAYDSTMDTALPIDDYYMDAVNSENDPNYRERNRNAWITDAWSTLLNERDNINLMSERGELIKDVLPTIEDINYELNYLDTKKQINDITNQLSESSPGSEKYNYLSTYLQELINQKSSMQSKYDSLLKHYGDKEGDDIDARTKSLLQAKTAKEDRATEIKNNITELNQSLQDRNEREGFNVFGSKVSDRYQAKETAAHDASVFDKAYWKYAVPGITGSSMATLQSYAYSAAAAGVAQLGRHYATTGIANLNPYVDAMGWASAIGATALNVYGNYVSRDRESMAQAYGAGKSKIEQSLKDAYGIDLNSLSGQAREQFRKQNPGIDDSKMSDQEMIDRTITGEIQLDIPELNEAKSGAKDGMNNVYWNNMALSIGDVAESALVFAPLGKAMGKVISAPVKPLLKPITRAAEKISAPTLKKLNNVIDNAVDFGTKINYKKPILAGTLKSAKALGKIGFVAAGEAIEEGIQDVYDFDYIKGRYDNKDVGFWNSLLNYGDASVRTAKIISGIDTESELANDPQFYNDIKGGFALGLLLGGPISGYGSAKQIGKDYKANKFVRDMVADNIGKKDQMNKAVIYSDKAVGNKQEEVISVLEGFRNNLPEGVTEEDLNSEIDTAKNIMNVANAKNTKNIATATGITRGTNEYNVLVGLQTSSQANLQEASINLANEVQSNNSVYDNALNSSDLTLFSFAKEDKPLLVQLSRANIEKQALLDLQEALKAPETAKQKFGISNTEIGNKLKSIVSSKLAELDNSIDELSKTSAFSSETNFLPSLEEAGKQSYLRALIAEADAGNAAERYQEIFGITLDKKGKYLQINKLEDTEKKKVAKKIIDRVNSYINNSEESQNNAVSNAKKYVEEKEQVAKEPTTPIINGEVTNNPIISPEVEDDDIIIGFEPESTEKEDLKPVKPTPTKEVKPVKKEDKKIVIDEDEDYDLPPVKATPEQEAGASYDEKGNLTISTVSKEAIKKNALPTDQSTPTPTQPAETQLKKKEESDELLRQENLLGKLEEMSTNEKNELIDDFLDIFSNMGNSAYDKVSHTLFYSTNSTTPLLPGYKTGKELSELMKNPRIMEELQFEFLVQSDTRAGYPQFDAKDSGTFKDAAVFVIVKHGKDKYVTALKTPRDADNMLSTITSTRAKSQQELEDRMLYDNESISRLIEYRNAIINAYILKKENEIVVPTSIVRTNGLFDDAREGKSAVFRPIQKVKGLEIPSDPFAVTKDNVHIGIGRGVVGKHTIVDANGSTMPGKGGSGQIFIYPKPSQTPSGKLTPIQINVQRFGKDIADFLTDLVIKYGGDLNQPITVKDVNTFVPAEELITFLARFGEGSLINPSDTERLHFLLPKQFAVVDGELILGSKTYKLSTITPAQRAEVSNFIATTMHWRINKSNVFGTMEDALPSVARYFEQNPKASKLALGPIIFDRYEFVGTPSAQGVSMPTLGWYMKNNLLQSDLKDNLFKDSFMYADGVSVITKEPTSSNDAAPLVPQALQVPEPQQDATPEKKEPATVENNPFRPGEDPLTEGWDDYGLPRVIKNSYEETMKDSETSWLMDKLGLSSTEVAMQDTPIMLGGDVQAMGLTRADAIVLFKDAEVGTAYHEAFHRVSTLLLSPRERLQIYDAYRKKTGFKGTNRELEEALAEEFRDYKLNESPSDDYRITKFFKAALNFIKKWTWFTDTTINNIFSRISTGYFSNKKINQASLSEFKARYAEGLPFTMKGHKFKYVTAPQFRETVKSLTAQLFMLNQVKYADDISKLDFNKLYYALSPQITNANNKLTQDQKNTRNEIFETFEKVFKPKIEAQLKNFSLKAINKTDKIEEDAEAKASGEGVADAMQQYILPATEISKKDNALGAVKIFIATIPKLTFLNGDYTKPQRVVSPTTGLYLMNDFDKTWNIVLNNLHDCSTFSQLLSKSKEIAKTIPFFYAFSVKLDKLTKVEGSTEAEKQAVRNRNELMQTQLVNTINSAYHNMVGIMSESGTDNDGNAINTLSVRDANVSRASKEYPIAWNFNLLNNEDLFKKVGNNLVPVKSEIKKIISSLYGDKTGIKSGWKLGLADRAIDAITNPMKTIGKDKTPQLEYWRENLESAKRTVLDSLNSVGVMVDMDSLNELIRREYFSEDPVVAFSNFLNSELDGGIKALFTSVLESIANVQDSGSLRIGKRQVNINEAYKTVPVLRNLAEIHATFNPAAEELAILSVDGKLLYPMSEHNYLSETIQEVNTNPGLVARLSNVLYNTGSNGKGSMLLTELAKGAKLKFNTMVYFKQTNSTDKGRKYTEISPLEDYVAKMTFVASDHLVLPTMGDSAMYNTISGSAVKLIHKPLMLDGNTIMFDAKVLDRFINYFLAELDTVEFNYANENKINKENAVKNYDTGNRNGYRFRYFNGFYKVKQAEIAGIAPITDFTNFNEALALAEDLDDSYGTKEQRTEVKNILSQIRSQFEALDQRQKYSLMNQYAMSVFKSEVEYASTLGLVKWDGKKLASTRNLALDDNRLATSRGHYSNSKNQVIKDNVEAFAALELLSDYFVNSIISIEEFEKLFIKDPAYYKDETDKIKRIREVLSTGTTPRTEFEEGNPLNDLTEVEVAMLADNELPSSEMPDIVKYATRAASIDLLKTMTGVGEEEAIRIYDSGDINNGDYKEVLDAANTKVSKDFSGYMDVNQTDATVLISPTMYEQLVRRIDGWTDEVRTAFELLNDPNGNWENDKEKYIAALGTTMKPLKCMYFGDHFDDVLKRDIPVFDKMAMFPVHRIFATGDMKVLLDIMENPNKPVHMMAFESAVKVGQYSKTKFYKDATNTEINMEGLQNIPTHRQSLKNFRRQLITDPHHTDRQMFVTQAQKAAMGNLRVERTYTTPFGKQYTGEQVKSNIMNAWDALTAKGKVRVEQEFGILENEDGSFSVDVPMFADVIAKDAVNSGMNQNVIDGLEVKDGKLVSPLSGLSDNNWIESRIISAFNREIIDVKLPGGMFIQMSSFTYNRIATTSDKESKRTLNMINPDGSMDCVVSINLLKHVIPGYSSMTFKEAKDWLTKNNIIGPDAKAVAMGYRIPAQGQSSMAALKVVDIWPEQIADTITLPDAFTKLTGSDFDIDKLFIARYNFNKNGKIVKFQSKEDYTESLRSKGYDDEFVARKVYERFSGKTEFEANSREANENMLLDMYLSVLMNMNNFLETKTPLDTGTDVLKKEILKDVDELSGGKVKINSSPLYLLSPQYQSRVKEELNGGKNGIAPFALAAAHHSLTQLVGLEFAANEVIASYGIFDVKGIVGKDGSRILDWLSAMINAHVDVAKDPYIIRLNVRKWTFNMTNLLLRSGIGDNTFYFLPQAILKEMAVEVDKYEGIFNIPKKAKASTAVTAVLDKYKDKATSLASGPSQVQLVNELFTRKGPRVNVFKKEYLRTQLKKENTFDWYYNQLLIYKAFQDLEPFANDLNQLVTLSQIDTKKFGNNFALQGAFMYRWNSFIATNKSFVEPLKLFTNTFLYKKIQDGIIFPKKAMANVLLRTTPEFENKRTLLFTLTDGLGSKDSTYVNNLTRAMEASFKSNFFNKYAEERNIDLSEMVFGEYSIPKRLDKLKSEINRGFYPNLLDSDGSLSNALLNSISQKMKITELDKQSPDALVYKAIKSGDGSIDDDMIIAWEELLDSEYSDVKKFAKDLAVYAFFTSGDNFGMNSIFSFVPNSFREEMGYFDFIRGLEENPQSLNAMIPVTDIFENMWWNDNIVPLVDLNVYTSDNVTGETYISDIQGIWSKKRILMDGDDFNFPYLFVNENASKKDILGLNSMKQPIYAPYVKVKLNKSNDPRGTLLYKLVGIFSDKPVYLLQNKKGMNNMGSVIVEYGRNASVIPYNNVAKPTSLTIDKILAFGITKGNEDDINLVTQLMGSSNSDGMINITDYKINIPTLSDGVFTGIEQLSQVVEPTITETIVQKPIITESSENTTSKGSTLSSVSISTKGYAKSDPWDNPDTDYVFTENAEAYTFVNGLVNESIVFPNPNNPKINVSDVNGTNQAGIRTDAAGNITPNAYGIIVKKYQQDKNGKFVAQQGQFNDNDADFKMFTQLNKHMFDKLASSNNSKVIFPSQMALGKAALPKRFVEWLQNELLERFSIASTIEENVNDNYSGYGLKLKQASSEPTQTEIKFEEQANEKKIEVKPFKDNTFRFSNGFTVTTPFVLNDEQVNALQVLERFVNGRENELTLSGYAGTGKTTIMSIFDKYLASKGITPFYSSPTHRANAVTKLNNPSARVMTLHALFGLGPEIKFEDGNYSLRDLQMAQKNKAKINRGDILIIDEASMVNKTLYDFIQSAIGNMGLTVIYVGDKGQLKPVKDEGISPVFESTSTQSVSLTKVERTGNNPILKEATALRQGKDLSYTSEINSNGEGITYSNNDKEMDDYIRNTVLSDNYKNNKLYFKALSATNAVVTDLNIRIRSILFNKPGQVEVGDVLMGYDNFGVDYKTGEAQIINSGDYEVISVTPVTAKVTLMNPKNLEAGEVIEIASFKVKLQNLLNTNVSPVMVTIGSNAEDNVKLSKIKDNVNALNMAGGAMRASNPRLAAQYFQTARAVSSQIVFMKNIEDEYGNLKIKKTLDYGYAHTIHKSQGGTYSNVLILDDTIERFRGSKLDKQQLRYVAVSRASQFVFVSTAEKVNNVVAPELYMEEDYDIPPVKATPEQESKVSYDALFNSKEEYSDEYKNNCKN